SQMPNLGPHQVGPLNPAYGPWGQNQIPIHNQTSLSPGYLQYPNTPGSSGYNPLLLNQELSLINNQLGQRQGQGYGYAPPVLPYPNGGNVGPIPTPYPVNYMSPTPVQPVPWGVGGSYNYTNGTSGGYVNGVI